MLFSCAGSPPKPERKVKLYNGAPEMNGICRLSRSAIKRFASRQLKTQAGKDSVATAVKEGFAVDPKEIECVRADSREFARYGCYAFDDIGVILRWQEALLHTCEKWGTSTKVQKLPEYYDALEVPQEFDRGQLEGLSPVYEAPLEIPPAPDPRELPQGD